MARGDLEGVFAQKFGYRPKWEVRAPGRVNILGEHTDYNEGFVFPAAIDRHLTVLSRARRDMVTRVFSVDFGQLSEFDSTQITRSSTAPWSNYVRGTIGEFQRRGYRPCGMDLVIHGNVPIGAGLSSSAAIEVAVAETVRVLNAFPVGKVELALLSQAAEREFVGVQCGIMDQFVSTLAEEGRALFLDCRDLSYRTVPLGAAVAIVVCDSKVQRSLDNSAYNQRRSECEEAVATLQATLPEIRALRDVSLAQLEQNRSLLSTVVFQRARHVVLENDRVKRGIRYLGDGRVTEFAGLLFDSHESLRDDYEVSCPELDLLVDLAREAPGVLGARMTGAGFGGCTVNLVEAERVAPFSEHLRESYLRRLGRHCETYACQPSQGVTSRPL